VDLESCKVDVLMPYHRVDKFLHKAIKSIQESRNVSIRLILIDDTQGPEKLKSVKFKEYLNNLANLEIEIVITHGVGYAKALNSIKEKIESPYVALLNSDDFFHPLKIFLQIQKIKIDNSDICIGRIIKRKMFLTYPSIGLGLNRLDTYNTNLLLLGAYGSDASILVKRDIWLKYFHYPTEFKSSDWVAAFDIYDKLKISFEPKAIYYYRVHAFQTTKSQYYSDSFNEMFLKWQEYLTQKFNVTTNFETGATLASPSTKISLNKVDYVFLKYLMNVQKDIDHTFTRLLKRRINLYLIKNGRFPKYLGDATKLFLSAAIRILIFNRSKYL